MLFTAKSSLPKAIGHKCAACGRSDLSLFVRASTSGLGTTVDQCKIEFYRCNYCESINEFSSGQGFYDVNEDNAFANFYLDIGAGIEEMIDPIARFARSSQSYLTQEDSRTFLELGCGFGFVVDYANKILGWQSQGIEPGGYGRIGSQALGVRIDHNLLGQGSEADGKKYDCIYASEVLEHLCDPHSFLHVCHDHLNEDGVLIMTTPAAEYINSQNPIEEVYACLFPGEHKIIFSRVGLEIALTRAGFQSFQLDKRRDNNWVILASPFKRLESIYNKEELNRQSNEQYHEYLHRVLEHRTGSSSLQQQRVKLALCFRLIKYLVNQGKLDDALDTLRDWYSEIASLADPGLVNLDGDKIATFNDETLICSVLSLCSIGLGRERIEVELYRRTYPCSGAAFLKTLGFFVTIIAHNCKSASNEKALNHVILFLESLISYAIHAKGCDTPFYHLELISLIGPATSSLFLAKRKLGFHLSPNEYPFISQDWFYSSYPTSHFEIQSMLASSISTKDPLIRTSLNKLKSALKTIRF